MKRRILIVDDEPNIRETIGDILKDTGYEVVLAKDGEEACKVVGKEDFDTIILDVMLPGKGGLEVLEYIHQEFPIIPVIIISGHGNIKMAVEAMRKGAYDFMEKPPSIERILATVRNAINYKNLLLENMSLKSAANVAPTFVGKSPVISQILSSLPQIAQSDASVLITGENGTGKEVIARLIHFHSRRRYLPFVGVNCAAIPETLIESELFGYEKGAFTGANKQKKGKFEQAHRGTLFLDEVGDLSLPAQAKVLRVLQENEFERVGGNELVKVDVRIIAATNQNLQEKIQKGEFREDLYYRLNVLPLHLPPLRERREDIPELVEFFLEEERERTKRNLSITKDALNFLASQPWKGNVRELKNFIQRLAILCPDETITLKQVQQQLFPTTQNLLQEEMKTLSLKEAKREFERQLILDRLAQFHMNIAKTAESLDIERTYLYRKMKELDIMEEE
ncbi:sigma-54-dependent transcriptional regulator [Thermospira aquatica]|uniref:Sigma-54-dependent Fis family transcriptional regulator n=1 Tax=Thermospira aquatica TaxID=2828656 RepID=A0AAX3BFB6_9SPIR|nr:sigma-54 dependent transcriptional regulator [Thermospira aquatica]URA11047.1 sigma-54-dependent Fis family transcriptional regulator [Thermospira aquatica]